MEILHPVLRAISHRTALSYYEKIACFFFIFDSSYYCLNSLDATGSQTRIVVLLSITCVVLFFIVNELIKLSCAYS